MRSIMDFELDTYEISTQSSIVKVEEEGNIGQCQACEKHMYIGVFFGYTAFPSL